MFIDSYNIFKYLKPHELRGQSKIKFLSEPGIDAGNFIIQ